jgi:hypothetical protein
MLGGERQAGSWRLWVKRTDRQGTQYHPVESVDPQQLVAELIRRWASERIPPVDPSLVTLRLVRRGTGLPTSHDEATAEALDDQRLSLLAARLENDSSLEAVFAQATGAPPPCCWPR